MRTTTPMTTADALRIDASMTALVDACGIKDPKLRKILIDQFNEEASNGMECGMTVDQIIAENDRRIQEWPQMEIPTEEIEAACWAEVKARGL